MSKNANRPWWPGQDDVPDLADRMLAPRGLVKPTPEEYTQAAKDVGLTKQQKPALPGLWVSDRDPGVVSRELTNRWRRRAYDLAQLRSQRMTTSESVKAPAAKACLDCGRQGGLDEFGKCQLGCGHEPKRRVGRPRRVKSNG